VTDLCLLWKSGESIWTILLPSIFRMHQSIHH
jgi:hypothetical protein